MAKLMEADLLLAEVESMVTALGIHDIHAETSVEDAGCLNAGDGEDEMIDAVEDHRALDA
jgi:hypothetical protein